MGSRDIASRQPMRVGKAGEGDELSLSEVSGMIKNYQGNFSEIAYK